MTDFHIHTSFSPDGTSTIEEYCLQAQSIGCTHFAVCDHLDIGYPDRRFESIISPSFYISTIEKARKLFPELNISLGMEAGYIPSSALQTAMHLSMLPLDFVINSVHVVDGQDPYFPEYFENKTRENAYNRYLECVYESLDAPYDFSVLGHITYVSRTAPYLPAAIEWRDAKEILDAILLRTVYLGKGLEINTSSIKSTGSTMPTESILRRFNELGGEIVTIASDAHNISRLCSNYSYASTLLQQCGFEYTAVFQNMQPIMLKL